MSRFGVEVLLHWLAVGLYGAAAALFANAVLFDHPRRVRWALRAAACGLLPHGVAIALRWIASGHGPYMLKYEVLSSIAWTAVALLALFVARRPEWAALALPVLPIAILMIGVGLFSSPHVRELPPSLRSVWLVFHITFAKISAGAFLLSTSSASLLLAARRGVARPRWAARLPADDALEDYTVRFIGFGFFAWTVTVAAGAVWAHQAWGRYWGWDAIETWSLVTWLVYGTFLHARFFLRLSERATAWASIGCFAVFVLTLLILPFLLPSLHAAYMQ